MHPALRCWREELPATLVRLLAYVSGAAVLAILAAQLFQARPSQPAWPAPRNDWVDIERPLPAFALAIPEAADVAAHYTIRHNNRGGGRKDILSLGDADNPAPYLAVEIYRPGREIVHFAAPAATIAAEAAALGPSDLREQAPLASKFGPLSMFTFVATKGTPRQCLGFVRSYTDPRLQLAGWFCRGGELIERSTLACALDRLTLLSAGSEPKVGALFADAELHRSLCGQHDPILASTPKYKLLWKALATRPLQRRIGP
jgi:hypothetical protein